MRLAYEGISIEVHISNTHKREVPPSLSSIRRVTGVIAGFGAASYTAAMTAVDELLSQINAQELTAGHGLACHFTTDIRR